MTPEKCDGFHVLEQKVCYPINFGNPKRLMQTQNYSETMEIVKDSHMVHFWNGMTKKIRQDVTKETPYVSLARRFCPAVFNTVEVFF